MKKFNYKYVIVFFVLMGIISLFFIRNDTYSMKNDVQEEQQNEHVENENIHQNKIANEAVVSQNSDIKLFINPSQHIIENYNKICSNVNFVSFKGKIRNEKELFAFDTMDSKCKKWANYWDSLTNEKKEAQIDEIKKSREMELFFQNALEQNDKSVIDLARSVMDTGGDSSLLTTGVLNYLLEVDMDLNLEIGKRMNVKKPESYIRNIKKNSSNIVGLYGCAVEPEIGCNSNSIGILSLCANYGMMCGMSFDQFVSEETTVNQFNDLLQIVSIIRLLVAEGYFDT